jgi:photosystem II stability/assembly factor-like uncharacterized protein
MTIILAAMQDSLLLLESSKSGWRISKPLKGKHPQCMSFDHKDTNVAYCGTLGDGLWKTNDHGQVWSRIGMHEIPSSDATSVSVNRLETNIIFVGTEPTALYRSDDEGETWHKLRALNNLKSSATWSFPPRPWTSHVRCVELDATNPNYIFVAIEAGTLVQSRDGGKTWIDRVDGGPYDTHTMTTHQRAPKHLYSSAGDGYFESTDYGESWKRPTFGLEHNYLFGLAIDTISPETIIISASETYWQAHSIENANSVIYRRRSGEKWQMISEGLPAANGTIISILASNPSNSEEFYAINNRGIFRSSNSGISWRALV